MLMTKDLRLDKADKGLDVACSWSIIISGMVSSAIGEVSASELVDMSVEMLSDETI